MSDIRLIERWLPIAALGEESVRERRFSLAGSVLPPNNSLHVWWARRPLIASRAAVIASLLDESFSHEDFMKIVGIKGDPVAARKRNDRAIQAGKVPAGDKEYGYPRSFKHNLNSIERDDLHESLRSRKTVLDPTGGGGSIPFEAVRLGLETLTNDLNPVAALIQKATIEYPLLYGQSLVDEYERVCRLFMQRALPKFANVFPPEPSDTQVLGFLWARTVRCPYCEGLVPLSPNWRLAADGTGVRLVPRCEASPESGGRYCDFEIVSSLKEHSSGTVADGDGTCPFPDCGRIIDGSDIKKQAQAGSMGEQLYAVAFKQRTKSVKGGREKWVRGFRTPRPEDDNSHQIRTILAERMDEWEALDIIPTEFIGDISNYDRGHRLYGMYRWADMFSPRQLLGHGIGVEVFKEVLDNEERVGISELTKASMIYLAFALDKLLNWNARSSSWNVRTGTLRSVFDRHDFAFKWTYAEMAPLIVGTGYEWVLQQTGKSVAELVRLIGDQTNSNDLVTRATASPALASITVTCKPGEALSHIESESVDAIVMDPPYYDNVMYAELSDFFYVWLKRTAGHITPELFTHHLTDKENEAVANLAKFDGSRRSKTLAGRDYQDRMARIFEECRRVLKQDGIMTLMFTHKATGAWDALTTGLMKAGFAISASWPINTEAEGSMHIKDKSAANSTIFLVCRPRASRLEGDNVKYWEDVEPEVAAAVRQRVPEFQAGGITGVDLYLASFGPALEEFSKHWPLQRGTPRSEPATRKRRMQAEMFEEVFDPYAVTPEDALEAARREVKTWRLNQLMHMRGKEDLDPVTSWFVLAWDAFKAPVFAYDEGLRLARAVGVDLESLIGRLCEKKGSDLKLWDSAARAAKGVLGPVDGSQGMLDVIHHVAHLARTRSVDDAVELLTRNRLAADSGFLNALEAVLEVLPPSKGFLGFDVAIGDAKASADDFDALERLRRVAFADVVDQPKQLELFVQPVTDAQVAAE